MHRTTKGHITSNNSLFSPEKQSRVQSLDGYFMCVFTNRSGGHLGVASEDLTQSLILSEYSMTEVPPALKDV